MLTHDRLALNVGGIADAEMPEAFTAIARRGRESRVQKVSLGERLVTFSLVCDSAIVLFSMIASFFLRFRTGINEIGVPADMELADYAGYIAFGSLSLIFTLTYFKIYERELLLRFQHITLRIARAGVVWLAGFLLVALVFKFSPPISRIFVLLAGINTVGALLVWRLIFHWFLRSTDAASELRQRILFVGWNAETARLSETLAQDACSPYSVAGCVTSARGRFDQDVPPEVPHLGHVQEIRELIYRHVADVVILSDVDCVKGEIVGLANLCEREMIQFKIIPSYFQILVSGLHLESVNSVPILGVSQLPLDRFFNLLLKRIVDIAGAIVGLILSAPIIAAFSVILRRESPGPVFFKQERMGRNGRPFFMYKIRSMHVGSEKSDHLAQSTTRQDNRVLRSGRFMRKLNIDELPQFWNVLKGEMSLVGPRPERIFHSEKLSYEIPHYNARHGARPGMTGWAQVKGLRGDTDLTERVNSDLFYLENWSVLLDFHIMLLTLTRNKNAC